jgi:hypothetical protein
MSLASILDSELEHHDPPPAGPGISMPAEQLAFQELMPASEALQSANYDIVARIAALEPGPWLAGVTVDRDIGREKNLKF